MLSIENSSDPSCSSSKASDLVSCYAGQPQLAPKFSIRDYVFRIRSKDIRISWPFREQLLQLCLDNGISELLPPLQPRSVVKSHCIKNKTVFVNGELKDGVELECSLPLDSSVSIPKEKRKLKVKLTRSESEYNASSLTSHVPTEEILGYQLTNNKWRLAEDLVSNLSAVSDPMASKICPVCKLFTSSSNTTLNAHIDQCLSSDQSNATKDDTAQFFKPKVKPRKKRLMVDIYKTAPYCTLEDLHRRNGINWAGSSAVVAPTNDVDLEPKRPKISPLDVACEGNVGDIYVDSNGTKLLILSKVDDTPPPVSRKSFKLKKHGKGSTASPSSFQKKNMLTPKCSKLKKNNPQSRKLSTVKGFQGEIPAATEIEHVAEDHQEKEGYLSHPLNAHDHVEDSLPSTLGHWVCSKRSNLTRKLISNDSNKGLENMIATTAKVSFKRAQPDEGQTSTERVCALNLPSSSDTVIRPKFKDMDILSRPSKTCKSLREGDCFDASLQPSSPRESDHRSLKDKKSLISKMSYLSRRTCLSVGRMKVDKRKGFITHKKFKKHRSVLACSRWIEGERCSGTNAASYGSTKDCDLSSSRANEAGDIHSSSLSENQKGESLVVKDQMRSANLEHAESISGDEIQIELLAQRSSDNQEVHCQDVISNGVVSDPDILISVDHAEPTVQTEEIQDHNLFFSSDGDMGPEKTQENTSSTSIRVKPNHDHNTNADMEVSGCSEVSNTSTIAPPSPMNDNSRDFKSQRFSSLIVRKDNEVKSSPSPRGSSCSCSESLSQLSNETGKNNAASNMFMKPPTLDSSRSCSQPASKPVLRLMGKDLVVNKEEYVQMPKILPYCTNHASEAKFISFGVPHNVGFIGYNNYYNNQMQAIGNRQFPNSPLMFAQPQPMFLSNQAREVIVIDDDSHALDADPGTNFTMPAQTVQNSNAMAPQRLFTCIPSQNPYASRVFTSNRRAAPEGSFIFPSPSSLCLTPSFR